MLFRTLGILEITSAAEVVKLSAEKPRRLLSLLLLRANHWVSDAELIDVLWLSGAPASAQGNIKSYVSQLRSMLGPIDDRPNRIERIRGAYRLTVGRDELDTMIFEDLVERGKEALTTHDPEKAASLLIEALEIWRGTPFESLDIPVAKTELARLAELRWTARYSLVDALVADNKNADAIALLRTMTVDDPLREQSWHRLMATLDHDGRRAEALAVYQEARRTLVDELGIEPGTDLQELHAKVLDGGGRPEKPVEVIREAVLTKKRLPRLVPVAVVLVLIAAAVAVLVITTSQPEQSSSPPVVSRQERSAADLQGWGAPVRSADFSGNVMDPEWHANGPWPSQGSGHYVPGHVTIRDDLAVVTGSPNGDTGHLWRMVDTRGVRVEVRFRIPAGCECHRPGMSLWSDKEMQRAGEIVFLDVPDGDRQRVRFQIHHPDRLSVIETRQADLTKWTTVAVEWTGEHVTGYLNGEQWFRSDDKQMIPTSPLRPTIKMDWRGGANPGTSTMEIDWVRVYNA